MRFLESEEIFGISPSKTRKSGTLEERLCQHIVFIFSLSRQRWGQRWPPLRPPVGRRSWPRSEIKRKTGVWVCFHFSFTYRFALKRIGLNRIYRNSRHPKNIEPIHHWWCLKLPKLPYFCVDSFVSSFHTAYPLSKINKQTKKQTQYKIRPTGHRSRPRSEKKWDTKLRNPLSFFFRLPTYFLALGLRTTAFIVACVTQNIILL